MVKMDIGEYNTTERDFLVVIKPSKVWKGHLFPDNIKIKHLHGTSGGGLAIVFTIDAEKKSEYAEVVKIIKEAVC